MVTMVTMGGDLQPGCLADRLLTGFTDKAPKIKKTARLRMKNVVRNCDNCCCSTRLVAPTKKTLGKGKKTQRCL